MFFPDTLRKFLLARVPLVLPLLLLAFSLQSVGQANTNDKQRSPATKETDNTHLEDFSKWPGLLFAFEGGSGWSSPPKASATAYSGIKLGGGGFTLDLGYDRIQSHSGFSIEASGMLPVFRLPGPQKDETRNFLRIYAEPGLGYRAGGSTGAYLSTKVMMALFSDRRLTSSGAKWSPYIEVQRRFPVDSLLKGDTRVTFGLMMAICEHCGFD